MVAAAGYNLGYMVQDISGTWQELLYESSSKWLLLFLILSRPKAFSLRRFKRFEEKRSKPIKVWAENVWCHPQRSNPSPSTCEAEAKSMNYQGDNPLVLQPNLKLKTGMATVSSSNISTITDNVYILALSNVFAFSHLLYKHRLVRCKGDKQIHKHDCWSIADTNRLLT